MVSSREQSPGGHNTLVKSRSLGNRSELSTPATPPNHHGRRETFTGSSTFGAGNMASSLGSATSLNTYESDLEADPTDNTNINVVVRVRPLNPKEIKGSDEQVAHFPGNGQIWLEPTTPKEKPKTFTYNVVFEPEASQEDVLNHSGVKRLIDMAIDGFSCTVFCYGQTGSGKTHTLTGPPHLFEKNPDPFASEHGLVFRSFLYLFDQIQNRNDFHFVLKASFLEIYNEKVIDLLNTSRKPLAVRWSKKSRGFFVENLFMVECEEFDDLLAVLEEGMRNRAVGRHNMNEYSSRSHTMLTVHITSEQKASEEGVFISRHGKLNFVDLAGSEMTKKTHSEGKTLEEANNINKSLMVLGYCIASLSDLKKKGGHIPYRDSKLTKLLADSLAGNGVTLMIACISPAKSNMSETLNTLRYAARAKRIKTKPVVVMDPREALIVSLKREVGALREENMQLRELIQVGRPGTGEIEAWRGNPVVSTNGTDLVLAEGLDKDKLEQMEPTQLVETVMKFLSENAALRQENWELIAVRDLLIRDQELVCRENERLLRKLEDVNNVCCRSPIAPVRLSYSADKINKSHSDDEITTSAGGRRTEDWPYETTGANKEKAESPNSAQQIPDSISKELEKRRIGKSGRSNISESYKNHKRNNSWDKVGSRDSSGGSLKSAGSTDSLPTVQGKRVVPKCSRFKRREVEEVRRKRKEIETKKAEEKKLEKEAKKQRREKGKKKMEFVEDNDKRTPESESIIKTEGACEKVGSATPTIEICEKEFGRLKLEKEQRKREAEEERRIEQLRALERSRGKKKYKKKQKKSKENDSQNICDSATDAHPKDNQQIIQPASSGQPLKELSTSNKKTGGLGRGADEKNNLVTIKKPMGRTIEDRTGKRRSMKGKEGESDLTLMNGQAFTAMPGMMNHPKSSATEMHGFRTPASPVTFGNAKEVYESYLRAQDEEFIYSAPTYQIPGATPNPIKPVSYQGSAVNSQNSFKDKGSMAEIDLSQLKLSPGLTKTKVPQDIGAPRCKVVNGVHQPEYHQRPIVHGTMMPNVPANIIPNAQAHMPVSMTPNMTDYRRCASVGFLENKHNSNMMIFDSRCSSLESPMFGICSHEMAFGAEGTRPSSEASFTFDRPSSGLDSLCNYNGYSSYFSGFSGYPSTSSPFDAVSRNETPSPAWQNDVYQTFTAIPGMINHPNWSATEMHGFWSSTPASPVEFENANAVYKSYFESYLRAQDEEFIKSRPQQRGMYPQMAVDGYPTSMDGRARSETPVSLQHTFVKPERPTPVVSVPAATYQLAGALPNPTKHVSYKGPAVNSQNSFKDKGSMAEIDLSQLKAPPGLTKTKVPQDIGAFTSTPGMINHPNSSATEMHGFWSSTPTTSVASANAKAAYENYLRDQDEEFIIPRPQQGGLDPQMAKRAFPSDGMAVDGVFTRKSALSDFKPNNTSNTSPKYNQANIQFKGPSTRNIGPVGYKPLGDYCHHQPVDQWTRLSPDENAAFAHTEVPLFTSGIFSVNNTEPWDSWGSARTVNPFGPIGSNLNRRPSNAASNETHGKLAETEVTDEASLWPYNRTF